ncbi:hypothetical protein MHYP_G00273150 [Metynnis hypsauchen]
MSRNVSTRRRKRAVWLRKLLLLLCSPCGAFHTGKGGLVMNNSRSATAGPIRAALLGRASAKAANQSAGIGSLPWRALQCASCDGACEKTPTWSRDEEGTVPDNNKSKAPRGDASCRAFARRGFNQCQIEVLSSCGLVVVDFPPSSTHLSLKEPG